MTGTSDLADYRRLEAEVNGKVITHKGYRSNPRTGERMIRYEETWHRGDYLGHGASGAVFLEQNAKDKDKVRAVKVLLKCRGASGSVDPFDEAVILSILSRPQNEAFFVNFYGWYETHTNLCLVMEYIKYGDLDNYLYEHGSLPEVDAKVITQQLLEGLEVIHQAGLLHRDLKPSNILIQHKSPWWVKIGDFGISKRLREKSAITYTGGGTDGFKAPEISFDERTRHTTAVDMWSLGCMTYKVLTNEVPFESEREVLRFRRDADSFFQRLDALDSPTNEAKIFLKSLIVIDPQLRATAVVAMTSPWITESLLAPSMAATPHPPRSSEEPTVIPGSHLAETTPTRSSDRFTTRRGQAETRVKLRNASQEALVDQKSTLLSLSDSSPKEIAAAEVRRRGYPRSGEKALRKASGDGDSLVVLLLLKQGATVDTKDPIGQTPLYTAASKGYEEVVRILLEAGATVNIEDNYGWTPLYRAACNGHEIAVQILLEAGATVDTKDSTGWTPLHAAAGEGHEKVVQILLEAGASANIQYTDGRTPLYIAASKGYEKVVRLLLEANAAAGVEYTNGRTPLHNAAGNGHKTMIQTLLKAGATIDIQDTNGWTPLHTAAQKGQAEAVRILLEGGANSSLRDTENRTAYGVAKKAGFTLGFAKSDSYEQTAKLLKPQKSRNSTRSN